MRALSLEDKLPPASTALLVIDVQNDYANPAGFAGQHGKDLEPAVAMLPTLLGLIDAARAAGVRVIHTRNWHREATDSEVWLDKLNQRGRSQDERPGRAGTWGAEFFGIVPLPGEEIISKFRYDAFLGTNLEYILRAAGIRTVVCAGTATNVCVESTARAAHMRDFHVVLAADCCAAMSVAEHESAVHNIGTYFGVVASAERIRAVWASSASVGTDTAVTVGR